MTNNDMPDDEPGDLNAFRAAIAGGRGVEAASYTPVRIKVPFSLFPFDLFELRAVDV